MKWGFFPSNLLFNHFLQVQKKVLNFFQFLQSLTFFWLQIDTRLFQQKNHVQVINGRLYRTMTLYSHSRPKIGLPKIDGLLPFALNYRAFSWFKSNSDFFCCFHLIGFIENCLLQFDSYTSKLCPPLSYLNIYRFFTLHKRIYCSR